MKAKIFVAAMAIGSALLTGSAMAQSDGMHPSMGKAVEITMGGHKMKVQLIRDKATGAKYVVMKAEEFEAMMGGHLDDKDFADYPFPSNNGS